jgi:flagellar motor switch protein FliM
MDTPAEIIEPAAEINAVAEQTAPPPFHFSAASDLSAGRRDHLENWHRSFLAKAAARLTDLLRIDLTLELVSVQVQTYAQMTRERGEDRLAALFRLHPQPGIGLLDVPLVFAHMIVQRMTGGAPVISADHTHDLTLVEQTVFQRFADTLLGIYARHWLPQIEFRPEVLRQEHRLNPRLQEEDGMVLLVAFKTVFKGGDCVVHLVTPIAAIEELLMKAAAPLVEAPKTSLEKEKQSPFGGVPVPVSIRWQGFQISLRDVDVLAAGDVLVLDNTKCERAAVWLGDRAKFEGRIVREAQKTTVTLTGTLE